MQRLIALGTPGFVRLMQLGGASARLADEESLAVVLSEELDNRENGIILLDPALAKTVPEELSERLVTEGGPRVLIPEQQSSSFLRDRIRQAVGADLMA